MNVATRPELRAVADRSTASPSEGGAVQLRARPAPSLERAVSLGHRFDHAIAGGPAIQRKRGKGKGRSGVRHVFSPPQYGRYEDRFLQGDDWMQHIDLRDIHKGRSAYDPGGKDDGALKGGEHTYMKNVARTRAYLNRAFANKSQPLGVEHYKRAHALAMAGAKDDEADEFRTEAVGFQAGQKGRVNLDLLAGLIKGAEHERTPSLDGMQMQSAIHPLREDHESWLLYGGQDRQQRKQRLEDKQKRGLLDEGVYVNFEQMSQERIGQAVDGVFSHYNNQIKEIRKVDDKARRNDQARRLIASVHQKLERLHPYSDGNGRVNHAILNELLIREGMSPVILDDPSSSHLVTTDDWAAQVERGQQRYAAVKRAIHRGGGKQSKKHPNRATTAAEALRRFDRANKTHPHFAFRG